MLKFITRFTRSKFMSRVARAPGMNPFGAMASRMMTRVNRDTSEDVVQRLGVDESHLVVELGPGSGWGLRAAAARRPRQLIGIEISPRFRDELSKVDFGMEVDVFGSDAIDMSGIVEAGSVDRLYGVNVVYFLNPLPQYAREFFRVMSPGGQALFAGKFTFIKDNDDSVFVNKEPERIVAVFEEAGFAVSVEDIDLGEATKNYTAIRLSKD